MRARWRWVRVGRVSQARSVTCRSVPRCQPIQPGRDGVGTGESGAGGTSPDSSLHTYGQPSEEVYQVLQKQLAVVERRCG